MSRLSAKALTFGLGWNGLTDQARLDGRPGQRALLVDGQLLIRAAIKSLQPIPVPAPRALSLSGGRHRFDWQQALSVMSRSPPDLQIVRPDPAHV